MSGALKAKIARLIAATGPIGVADYMAHCLFDPDDGYYTTREPFGVKGDFTTAPEISQMFGELVAVWLYSAWDRLGRPGGVTLAEIGPGRGTLMKDVLRTLDQLDAGFLGRTRVAMIEASPRLSIIQKQTLAGTHKTMDWATRLEDVPPGPLLVVGNELFDALPVRQYVKTGAGWHERVVGLDAEGELAFMAGPGAPDKALLPPDAPHAPEGAIVELAPARTGLMDTIAARLAGDGGAGLFIDYGHDAPGVGDTLQAVRRHARDDVLARPGEADLTAHVDFSALTAAAAAHGLAAPVTTQGDFLLAMGLVERAGRLGADRSTAEQEAIRKAVERLAGPDAMGRLFKVMALLPDGMKVAPFG